MNDNLLLCIADRPYTRRDVIPLWLEPHVELENIWEYVEDPEPVQLTTDGYAWGVRPDYRPPALDPLIDLEVAWNAQTIRIEQESEEKKQKRNARLARYRERARLVRRERRLVAAELRLESLRQTIAHLQEVDWEEHLSPDWLRGYSFESLDPQTIGVWRSQVEIAKHRQHLEQLRYRLRSAYIRKRHQHYLGAT